MIEWCNYFILYFLIFIVDFYGSVYDVYVILNLNILGIMDYLLEDSWMLDDFGYFLKEFFMVIINNIFILIWRKDLIIFIVK